jgi:flavin reductase (DIM6/NTAB) family NADH-FMN oxidoreductase RutF
MPVSDEFKHTVGKAVGRIPSGVFILTAVADDNGGDATAMMASWVQQAAFDPPALSVAVASERPIAQMIRATRKFSLSIVPDNDTTLMKRYARGIKPGEDAFAGVETLTTPLGIPALKSALAWLDCQLLEEVDFGGDHDLFVAEIVGGALLHPGHAFVHQRGSGFHY